MSRKYKKESLDAAVDSMKEKQMSFNDSSEAIKGASYNTFKKRQWLSKRFYYNRNSTEKFTSKYIYILKFGVN